MANQRTSASATTRCGKGSAFKMGRDDFVPLADVPDYVWIAASKYVARAEGGGPQHFADIDIPAIDGGPRRCSQAWRQNPRRSPQPCGGTTSTGFAARPAAAQTTARCRSASGSSGTCMVAALEEEGRQAVRRRRGGVMAHYVGDASQPLHYVVPAPRSPPHGLEAGTGKYPVAHDTEPTRLQEDARGEDPRHLRGADARDRRAAALQAMDEALADVNEQGRCQQRLGRGACTFYLMSDAHDRLPPTRSSTRTTRR